MRNKVLVGALLAGAITMPASAEVTAQSDVGFVVREVADVSATPAETWRAMTAPGAWWSSAHTFSGSGTNLSLSPTVGGCFCERFPPPKGTPATQPAGGVQHMRVIYVEPNRVLRLSGALGPLQSEALTGTLTMALRATDTGTHITWEYVVGGYMRYKVDQIAPAVDRMLAEQISLLAAHIAKPAAPVPAAPKPGKATPAQPAKAPSPAAPPATAPGGDEAANDAARAAFDAALKKAPAKRPGAQPRR
ncbi:SRPBCC family protein [Novosphingobium sp. EMRT-2]|uniref:SRPBCC family protein n=1 Tax=Novosphingobium sp. EMRT-2 TaxID=2571749 RepID=UPI0010BDBD87|nr:SRPBCC family protein [Novosphingobium sp. EMRT-2]QCI94444.1 SRPBCC family protein [Novosphingobium sp. EMRT-2]